MRLRGQLIASYVALTGLGMLLLATYVIVSLRQDYIRDNESDLAARATALSEHVSDWLERGDLARVRLIVRRYGAQQDIWLRVFDAHGQLLATSEPVQDARVRDWLARPGLAAALGGRRAHGLTRDPVGGDERLYESRPLTRGGRQIGVLRLSRTLAALGAHTRRAAATATLGVLLALTLSALASARLARVLSNRVGRMRDFAVAVGHGRFGARLGDGRRDELGELARELDAMGARLQALDGERRTFLANASHELRTPVTNLRATLEALEDGAADDPSLRARFLRTAVEETRRMGELIEALLDLGRLEAGVAAFERREVDLAELLARCVRALDARMQARGVRVTLRTEPGIAIQGDAERLAQALLNVLDNALKHSPAGGVLDLSAHAASDAVEISVRDQGAGIAAADLPRVFEQFYTADKARVRGGLGLGLAIARRVVEVHGGHITAANHPAGGAVVALRLPRDVQGRGSGS